MIHVIAYAVDCYTFTVHFNVLFHETPSTEDLQHGLDVIRFHRRLALMDIRNWRTETRSNGH